jgi:hypothetical protein
MPFGRLAPRFSCRFPPCVSRPSRAPVCRHLGERQFPGVPGGVVRDRLRVVWLATSRTYVVCGTLAPRGSRREFGASADEPRVVPCERGLDASADARLFERCGSPSGLAINTQRVAWRIEWRGLYSRSARPAGRCAPGPARQRAGLGAQRRHEGPHRMELGGDRLRRPSYVVAWSLGTRRPIRGFSYS